MESAEDGRILVEEHNDGTQVSVDAKVFSLRAVKTVCYRLADRAAFEIQSAPADKILIRVIPRSSDVDLAALGIDFHTELIDQDLREQVARETEALRNLILAHALSKVPLLSSSEETAGYTEESIT